MDFSDKIARYEEIERRGLLSQLPQEKQDMWAEYKRRQAKDSTVNNDTKNDGKQSYLEQMAGKVATLDRGLTFGLGRKALGAAWAAGAKLGDTLAGNDNAPDFWGRYHEFVDPVVEAQQQYAEEHPAEALTAEIAASIANPANKVGASYIGKGKSLADVAARASAVGGGIGGVAGAMNTEYAKDLFPNTAAGVGVGATMGGILPVAANRAGAVYNAIKRITMPEASVAGKATGLGNIVKDNESVRALSRGIMADDAVAAQVLQEAPTEMGRLNEELTDILNKTTGRKLNIEGAKQNADEAYRSYVAANADYPVYTTEEIKPVAQMPTKEQLATYPAEKVTAPATIKTAFDNPTDYTLEEWLSQPRKINQGLKNISLNDYRARKGYPIPGDDILDKMRMPHGMSENDKRLLAQQYEKNRVLYDKSAQEYNDLLDKGELPTYEDILDYGGASETSEKKIAAARMAWKKAQKQAEMKQNLINQLNTGQYADVPFGSLPENVRQQVNQIRINNGQNSLTADMIIPAGVVQKWGGNRMLENYSPERIAQIADEVYHSPNVKVSEGDYPHIQKLLKEREGHNNDFVGFISQNPKTGDTVAKTVYQTKRSAQTGRQPVSLQDNLVGRKRLSDLQSTPYSDNISSLGEFVNENVPNIKDIVGQLNEFKQNAMNKALAEGAAMSDYGAGSLDAVHKAQGVLNDMIENSFDKSVLGVKRPTTQTAELMGLKQVFTNMLEPSGVKSLDARIAKAKSLEYFYDMGYKFKPSEKKFEDLGIKTLRDKRAFLQGRLQAILDNVKDDKNLAKAIRADENTLKKLMPAKRFDELLSKTSEIDRQYTRLNKYIQLANRELDKPLAADRPMSERGESKLSYLGSLYDKANALMWQNANRRRAQALLNGGAQNPEVLAALERLAGRYNLGQITPYIAQLAAQNQ